ncbi:MAG: HAMP domain-containing histidine kinase [Leptolyngbyaceae cyanobacterium CSU_1_4]|nr:HAMP domain-containing histidine kinase [Leptolyngbyaceae cyanobacterium CSU_1_4]
MQLLRNAIAQVLGRQTLGRRISPTSLQFRLTLELITLSILGVGSVTLWAGWRMEKTLISAHKQNLEYIAAHLPEQVELYRQSGSIETGVERTIDKLSTPGLLIWVQNSDGQMMSRSSGVNIPSPDLIHVVAQTEVPAQPTVFHFGDRYVVLCGNPLTINGNPLGQVYLLKDITDEQERLNAGIHSLVMVSVVAIVILMIAIAKRIRRALQPLEQMSQVASAVSADDLSGAKLELHQAPDEILGLAQAFNEMLGRLSGSWEQQRQFVGNVSHELRTPLAVIAGYLQSLLRRGDNLSPHQQQAVATASAEAERTIRMLQDLLDLARVDSGNLHFRLSPIMLNTLVVEVAEMSQKVSHRPIQVLGTHEDAIACADQDRLEQVLINLVDNAIKYSDPDQTVELILEKTEQQARIHVRDRGIGIPLAHQNRIFERFYRVDESMTRSRDGTGLGLAIAKSLIEGMDGRIFLRSKPGEGSLFTITLPLWKPQS